MKKITLGSLFAALALGLPAQDAVSARAAYQERQALAEVPRLVQQFDQLAVNQDEIVQRLLKVEAGSSTEAALRAEIEALRAEIAELKASLRREQDAMRREIVADLAKRMSRLRNTSRRHLSRSGLTTSMSWRRDRPYRLSRKVSARPCRRSWPRTRG